LTVLLFTADINSQTWTQSAGILGGPMVVLGSAILWLVPTPLVVTQTSSAIGRKAAFYAYAIVGFLATVSWYSLVYIANAKFGLNYQALWAHVWSDAHASVAFMTIDAFVLWLSQILYLAYRKPAGALEAFVTTLLFGPGGSIAIGMAQLELDELERVAKSVKQE
jgi:hypothetical protein